jgi:hypothetical protein
VHIIGFSLGETSRMKKIKNARQMCKANFNHIFSLLFSYLPHLGAHASGFAGAELRKLHRITGEKE